MKKRATRITKVSTPAAKLRILYALIVIAVVSTIGYNMLSSSRAQSPYTSAYSADGTLTGPATKIAGGTNANSQAVQFGSAPGGGGGGTVTFQGDFETPVASGAIQPWSMGAQSWNYGVEKACQGHYGGSFYYDNGTGTTPSPAPEPGAAFNQASSALVPPGQGSWSARFVLPITPASTTGCPPPTTTYTHPLTSAALLGPYTNTSDLGSDKYYGMMFYMPTGETLSNGVLQGLNMWEFHFNAVWGDSIIWELHTSGTSNNNGLVGDSVVLAIESGSCNNANTTTGTGPGCDYRSNAGQPGITSETQPSCSNPASVGAIKCLPGLFVIPPGQVKYGVWNEIVMHVHWAADTTGSIQTWYKTKGATTWNASPTGSVSGIPTVQWDRLIGCTPGSTASGNCGYPNHEAPEVYTGALSKPFSINYDNIVIGTSLNAVENTMP